MDSDVVIQASGLSKSYTIGHRSESGATLRDALVRTVGSLARTTGDLLRGRPMIAGDELEEIWALRDVSFEVRRGEVLGIIGRNGAGKSTLLRVLSRITDPTAGRVEIRGRVASLLEVGTGFHQELTGRENIFLNGAILGMTRAEIRRKFDEIVDFAGVEKFLDTPVKRFSSGMYVRLAFAVAAHLEPEILIVDEVLAVGDAEFQKKCLGKMQDVAGEGRTVLFVSHNLAAVRSLCGRGLVLESGHLGCEGSIGRAIEYYAVNQASSGSQRLADGMHLTGLTLRNERDGTGQGPHFAIEFHLDRDQYLEDLSIFICDERGLRLCVLDLRDAMGLPRNFSQGAFRVTGAIPGLNLVEHVYQVGLYTGVDGHHQNHHSLTSFSPAPRSSNPRRYPAAVLGYLDAAVQDVSVEFREQL